MHGSYAGVVQPPDPGSRFMPADPSRRLPPSDQADGLRRLFRASRPRFMAVVANPDMAFSGLALERLAGVCTASAQRTLVVDAADSAPAPQELAAIDLAACIEPLTPGLDYLAARGLPVRYVNTRGSCAGFLTAIGQAAPAADVVIVHAQASELGRLFAGRAVRPLLLAADRPSSVTQAYAGLKLLALRHSLMAFDLLLAATPGVPRVARIAEQLALTADRFIGAALHDWVCIDPTDSATPRALTRLVHGQLHHEEHTGSALAAV
jgi:hypothetical protein